MLPKPQFHSADETSLKLVWDAVDVTAIKELCLQYKEPHQEWSQASQYVVPIHSSDNTRGVSLTEADVVDLKPGTAYFVRLSAVMNSDSVEYGPDTVFDTKPVDCGPKRKKCTVS